MNRIRLPWTAILLFVFAGWVFAQDTKFAPQGEQIPGPDKTEISAGQCCYSSGEIKDPAQAFKTWIEERQALATRALDSHGLQRLRV